jgi:hypothetical protein
LTSTEPAVASNSLGTRETRVVLPAPVLPMIAVVRPASARKVMLRSTGSAAPGYWNCTLRISRSARRWTAVTGRVGGTTDDDVSSTSPIRSAHTAARGTMISMKVAIMTDMRICIR